MRGTGRRVGGAHRSRRYPRGAARRARGERRSEPRRRVRRAGGARAVRDARRRGRATSPERSAQGARRDECNQEWRVLQTRNLIAGFRLSGARAREFNEYVRQSKSFPSVSIPARFACTASRVTGMTGPMFVGGGRGRGGGRGSGRGFGAAEAAVPAVAEEHRAAAVRSARAQPPTMSWARTTTASAAAATRLRTKRRCATISSTNTTRVKASFQPLSGRR